MLHVPKTNCPADLPLGGYHHDTDDLDVYRLPRNEKDDLYIQCNSATPPVWVGITGTTVTATALDERTLLRGIWFSGKRDNNKLQQELQVQLADCS